MSLDGHQVTINPETTTQPQEKARGRVFRMAAQQVHGSRSCTLDRPVDESRADASFRDGGLSLRLPMKPVPSTQRLSIR